jgi:hypothetical protein
VSIDAIINTNQKYVAYLARIKGEFDECKYLDKDYATMVMKRSQKTIWMCWVIIQVQVNTFHGYHPKLENISAQPPSTSYVRHCPLSYFFLCGYT